MAELQGIHYDAFISYRHCELDSFVAENLHKKLESFRLPKSVRSKVKNGKTKITRVFRDVDELPLSEDLSDPINNALSNTDFLITICTPRYPLSRWCMKEIEVFLQSHPRDHILVVLAEDEPYNSFPEILTYEEVEVKDEKGEPHIEQVPQLYRLRTRALIDELIGYGPEVNTDRVSAMQQVMMYREQFVILYGGSPDQADTGTDAGDDDFFDQDWKRHLDKLGPQYKSTFDL